MRVLVCGGRDFKNWEFLETYLEWFTRPFLGKGVTVIQGAASGADLYANAWAFKAKKAGLKVDSESFPAFWGDITHPEAVVKTRRDGSKYDALAGHRRNQQMLDEGKPDIVIAFPGWTGTADMVSRARKAGVKVIEVTYDPAMG